MRAARINYHITHGGALTGNIQVPGDKSVSHRALMLGAIAEGRTTIHNFLEGEDTLATMRAFREMGVSIDQIAGGSVIVNGVGLHGLTAPHRALDLGNSGTSVRLLTGLLCGQSFDSVLTGDVSLRKRPMRRIIEPLLAMQAAVECSDSGTLPISIQGKRQLQGIDYDLPVASAQLKSCLLLAGLYARGRTCIREPQATRDHTERLLQEFACPPVLDQQRICITGSSSLRGASITVPGDISSAAFFLAGASMAPGSDIELKQVGLNPTRHAIIEILQTMGCDITVTKQQIISGEPVGDIHVRAAAKLQGIEIPAALVPFAIDEFPAVMMVAAVAKGTTVLSGAAELRVKESDRIASLVAGLQAIGIEAAAQEDGLRVTGGRIKGGTVNSHGDHRIAMAFAMTGLVAETPIQILDCANVDTSFPGFVSVAKTAGLSIECGEQDG